MTLWQTRETEVKRNFLFCASLLLLFVGLADAQGETSKSLDGSALARANQLLRQMTVEEKIGQTNQLFFTKGIPGISADDPVSIDDHIRRGEVGALLLVSDPAEVNRLQRIAMTEQRLHIPILFGFDVIHGFDTEFPVPIGMAASWSPELVRRAEETAAAEAKANGIHWTFAPMVDIARDPRWGRISEGAGEDPYLGAAMARAEVIGFQGDPSSSTHDFIATLKHFAGYGAAEGGRDYDAAYIPEEELQNVYLQPFRAGVNAGAGSVMSAYMDLNDVPATGNTHLLQEILRKEMNFKGFVVSDAHAIGDLETHGYARDAEDAAVKAFRAGVSMDMDSRVYLLHLKRLIEKGQITEAELDNLVRPLLVAKYRVGLFEHPYASAGPETYGQMLVAHRLQSRKTAEASAVLLRNEANVLPLSKNLKRIAVLGPLADSKADMNGPWSLTAKATESVTVLEGIRSKLPKAKVTFAQGAQVFKTFPSFFDKMLFPPIPAEWSAAQADAEMKRAVDDAAQADVAVLALGESASMDFEYASRSSLDLPGRQQELLERVVATGKPVVVLLMSTRPLNLNWASEHVPAILDLWFGGTEMGNAAADLLFGDTSPGGKLPYTWPRSVGQIPIYYAHNLSHLSQGSPRFSSRYWDGPATPLFPFGFGLSYSRFAFSNLRLSSASVPLDGSLNATVRITNTGDREADDVVQLYLHQRYGSASRPMRELKGFERVTLAAGQSKDIHFVISKESRTYWSSAAPGWTTDVSDFDVWAGDDSSATLHASFSVQPRP